MLLILVAPALCCRVALRWFYSCFLKFWLLSCEGVRFSVLEQVVQVELVTLEVTEKPRHRTQVHPAPGSAPVWGGWGWGRGGGWVWLFFPNPALCRLSSDRAGCFGEVRAGMRHRGLAQCSVLGLHSAFAPVCTSGGFHLHKNAWAIQNVYFYLYNRPLIPSAASLKSFPLQLLSFQSR